MAAKNLMEVVVEEGVHMEPQNHPIMHQVIHMELHHRTKPLSLLTMLQSHHTIPLLPGKRFFSLSVPLLNYGQLFGHTVQNEIYYYMKVYFHIVIDFILDSVAEKLTIVEKWNT